MLSRISIYRFFVCNLLLVSLAACLAACSDNTADANTAGQTPSDSSQQPATSQTAAGGTAATGAAGATASGGAQAGTGTAGRANSAGAAAAGRAGATARAGAGAGKGGKAGGAGGKAGTAAKAGAGGSAPVKCPATVLPPGETTTTLQIGGVARTFILYVPQSYTGKVPVPFVTDWHPLQGNGADQMSGLMPSGYRALSDSEGFIAAWPNGIDRAWNVGPCCTTARTVDDLAFAKAIVTDVTSRACIDPKRIYATGYSMGGGMSHYLACNAADIFAAVVPAAFDLLVAEEEPCKPARPITVMSFRGTSDPLVPYTGGASTPPNGLNVTIHFLGAEGTFKKWAELDGCTGTPTDTGNGCQAYTQCKEGVEVTLCTAQGGGHVPGDANLGWAMMKKHPMP